MTASSPPPALPWRENPGHRRWLLAEADALFAFFEPDLIDPSGGFHSLDNSGRPLAGVTERPLHATTRLVHCFAIAHLLGRPGAADFVDHGMRALLTRHRDPRRAAISGRSTPTARASATSSPMAMPSCCSPPRAPNARAIPTRTGCSPIFPKCWRRGSGSPARAPAPRNSARTGPHSAPIAARIPTCT